MLLSGDNSDCLSQDLGILPQYFCRICIIMLTVNEQEVFDVPVETTNDDASHKRTVFIATTYNQVRAVVVLIIVEKVSIFYLVPKKSS